MHKILRSKFALLLAGLLMLIAVVASPLGSPRVHASAQASSSGTWMTTGSPAFPGERATLLANGQVLVTGGYGGGIASAELYDPSTGTWTVTGPMHEARNDYTATLLHNGQVLVAGGLVVVNGLNVSLDSAELYDPRAGTWTATGPMHEARFRHTATLLPNGQVLVAGGYGGGTLTSAELYDPSTGTWTTTDSLLVGQREQSATLLPNGQVLVAGGINYLGYLDSAELYDPRTGTWTATGFMQETRRQHTATLLHNGEVLVAGGLTNGSILPSASAELYDPSTGTWTTTGSMQEAREWQTAALLPTGQVLVAGGLGNWPRRNLASAELYDPSTGTWTTTGSMQEACESPTATLLATGQVLVTGGGDSGTAWAELYSLATDTTSPTTTAARSPDANAAGWNNSEVTVALSATDNEGGSGVKEITYSATGAQAIESTTVAGASASIRITAEGQTTLSYFATDNAGNVEVGQTAIVKLDKTAPTITIATPIDQTTYTYQQVVPADYSCTDAGSGAVTSSATVPSGSNLDTASVGWKTFSVSATDNAGNTASVVRRYGVKYDWSGVLQPVNADGSSIFKSGGKVPVRFQLTGASSGISTAVVRLYVVKIDNAIDGTVQESVYNVAADSGNTFRYDSSSQQYIFNLSTKGLTTGTYQLRMYVGGDNTTGVLQGQVNISLK